jgi:hypothetical protein
MLKLTLKIHSRLGWGSSGKYKRPWVQHQHCQKKKINNSQ